MNTKNKSILLSIVDMVPEKDAIKPISAQLFAKAETLAENGEKGMLEFPRGILHSAEHHRRELDFLTNYTLSSNIAYSMMMIETLSWLLSRFDLVIIGREMVIKDVIAAIGDIIESITVSYANPYVPHIDGVEVAKIKDFVKKEVRDEYVKNCTCGYLSNLKNRDIGCLRALTILVDNCIISVELKGKLKDIMESRNKIHLHKLPVREFGEYSDSMLETASASLKELIECLSTNWNGKKTL